MEWHMDAEMFLDEYPHWEPDGLHHPMILQEMFLQADHLGRREAEQMICWGRQHGIPHLDPQVDISAVWSVGPQTSREETRDPYHQVYKLRRLPRSLPSRLEWAGELTRDVVSSLNNCLGQKEDELPRGRGESELADTCLMQNKTPQRGRQGTLAKNELTEAREAHWRALATTFALEEK